MREASTTNKEKEIVDFLLTLPLERWVDYKLSIHDVVIEVSNGCGNYLTHFRIGAACIFDDRIQGLASDLKQFYLKTSKENGQSVIDSLHKSIFK